MLLHPVVSNIAKFCFSSNNDNDPAEWMNKSTSIAQLVASSQLLQSLFNNEIASFKSPSSSSSSSAPPPLLLQLQQRAAARRIAFVRSLFRSLLQPVVSNLLVAVYRTQATKISSSSNEDSPNFVNNTLAALTPMSSIKTKNSFLKLLHHLSEMTSPVSLLHKNVLIEFMNSAGFNLVVEGDATSGNYLSEGTHWQWSGIPVLEKILSSADDTALRTQFAATLQKLKDVESNILAPLERMLTERGGLLTADRITSLSPEIFSEAKNDQIIQELLEKELSRLFPSSSSSSSSQQEKDHDDNDFEIVSKVLAAKNEARKQAQDAENQRRFQHATDQARLESEAARREKIAAAERQAREAEEHAAKVAAVQPYLKAARKTLHDTGRVRNSSFAGVEWSIQPLNVASRIHMCPARANGGRCDEGTGLEVHWHLRAAPNVLYAFTAHLGHDGTEFVHLGEEIGYQYNTVPGMPHFGKTTMVNRKLVDENGKLEMIEADLSKEVTTCVCGKSFAEVLWK